MTGTLWATPLDRRRIAKARSAVMMVGSYDGSGNYGDVLQFAAALDTVRELPGSALPVAVVELDRLEHHRTLLRRYPSRLSGPAYVAFRDENGDPNEAGLVELERGAAPARSAIYLYGGGYLNEWWGPRKRGHVAAVRELAARGRLPLVASGLQVQEEAVAPGGIGHGLLSEASWIGLRGAPSLEYVRTHVSDGRRRVALAGDDAIPCLLGAPTDPETVVNLHLNYGDWVSDDPEAMAARIVALLQALGERSGARLDLQPVVAYEDSYVSERRSLSALLGRHEAELRASGLDPIEPLDALADAADNGLARFARARLTVSCSYHVALTSLLAGIPAVLLVENAYYDQKAEALRDLFELDDTLVGVRDAPASATAAAEVLVDGPPRSALVDHLRARSERLVARHELGREALTAALVAGLRRPTLRDAIRRRLRGG